MSYDFRVHIDGHCLCIELGCESVEDAIECAKEQWQNEGNDIDDIESINVQARTPYGWSYVDPFNHYTKQ